MSHIKKNQNQSPEFKADQAFEKGKYLIAKNLYFHLSKKNKSKFEAKLNLCYINLLKEYCKKNEINLAKECYAEAKEILASSINQPVLILYHSKNNSLLNYVKEIIIGLEKLTIETEKSKVNYFLADACMLLNQTETQELGTAQPDLIAGRGCVHIVLDFISKSDFESAKKELRNIGLKSPFIHWKMALKGVIAYYQWETTKANFAFQEIDKNTNAYKFALPYITKLKIDSNENIEPRELGAVIPLIGRILGKHSEFVTVKAANKMLETNRIRDAYNEICNKIDPNNYASNLIFFEAYKYFFYISLENMNPHSLIEAIDLKFKNKDICPYEIFFVVFFNSLYDLKNSTENYSLENDVIFKMKDPLYGTCNKFFKDENFLHAMVYLVIGIGYTYKIKVESDFIFMSDPEPKMISAPIAIELINKSIEIKPTLSAYQKLFEIYEYQNNKKMAKKINEKILEKYPDNLNALIEAGMSNIQNKNNSKGVAFLKKALLLDPLNLKVKTALLLGVFTNAQNTVLSNKKDSLLQARKIYKDGMAIVSDSNISNHGIIPLLLGWWLFEYNNGDKNTASLISNRIIGCTTNTLEISFGIIVAFREMNTEVNEIYLDYVTKYFYVDKPISSGQFLKILNDQLLPYYQFKFDVSDKDPILTTLFKRLSPNEITKEILTELIRFKAEKKLMNLSLAPYFLESKIEIKEDPLLWFNHFKEVRLPVILNEKLAIESDFDTLEEILDLAIDKRNIFVCDQVEDMIDAIDSMKKKGKKSKSKPSKKKKNDMKKIEKAFEEIIGGLFDEFEDYDDESEGIPF